MDAPRGSRRSPRGRLAWRVGFGLILAATCSAARGADLAEAEARFRAGRYDECAAMAAEEIRAGTRLPTWHRLKVESERARGKDEAALGSVGAAVRRFPANLPLRLLARDVYRATGHADEAKEQVDTIEALILDAPQRYGTVEGRVAVGRFLLARGADARKVLAQFFDVAVKEQPDLVEGHLAIAELALLKQDGAEAANALSKAPKEAADDARYHVLLARAFADGDRERAAKAVDDALKINPNCVDALILKADAAVDAEAYSQAEALLAGALEVDPGEPRAWAYRAVLAHLKSDAAGEESARAKGLARWAADPEVDHVIGRELSRKYRFAEGAARQRKALELDPGNTDARLQLCQDLLRLGDEAEGWALADAIFSADAYNVVAFNLVQLRDRLASFRTLQGDGFVVRMDAREADLYGDRVLALLKRARTTLGEKYGVAIPGPVTVEIFPRKQEFAVRTFGLPGAEGFLGVCFGRVITALSPAAQGESPANWEAVLWHEFCHAITLGKTRNTMPRWLSEGISVHEEAREDPAWGESLDPRFHAKLVDPKLTPLSELSSAFLKAASPLDLQFAYYESALAVDFLVEKAGHAALSGLLADLGSGIPIAEALPRRAGLTLTPLDAAFAAFARRHAEAAAPGATWDEPDLPPDADSAALAGWVASHPKSFPGRRRLAAKLLAEQKWPEARGALMGLKTLYPGYVGPENAYISLAALDRRSRDPASERATLDDLASRDAGAGPAFLRLMELDDEANDWPALARDARRMLAVNPLIAAPHRQLARAAEHLGRRDEAIGSYRALLLLDETDPAESHYRLARLLQQDGKQHEARREVLKSLEEAPRFLDAHRLLLRLVGPASPAAEPTPPGPPTEAAKP